MEVINSPSSSKSNKLLQSLPLVLLVIFIFIFFSTFQGLYGRWIKWDEGLSHGLLVNAVFAYLLLKSLPWKVQANTPLIAYGLYAGLASASLLWFIFHLSNIYIFEQLLLLVLLAGLYASCYGIKTVMAIRLLLLLPIFTIPLWEQLTNSLVNLSGYIVGKMVRLIDIPAVIEGNSIFIPSGHIVIADGCSGLRYFEIALALAYIIGLLNNYNEKRLIPTLLIAAALGLIANWIRIFTLVIIGYQTEMQSSLMSNHEYFGWALFGIMCLPAIYFAPIIATPVKQSFSNSARQIPHLKAPLCLIAIGPILSLFFSAEPVATNIMPVLSTSAQRITAHQMPVIVTAPTTNSVKENIRLTTPSNELLFAEVDQYQRIINSDKLVPYISRLYSNEEWLAETRSVAFNSHKATLTKLNKKTSTLKILQLQWFEVGTYKTASLTIAKLLQIPALINGSNNFKIVTLQSPCNNEDCTQAEAILLNAAPLIFTATNDH